MTEPMAARKPIASELVPSVAPAPASPRAVANEFRRLLDSGAELRVAGSARRRPRQLLSFGYVPRFKLELFDTRIYLSGPRQNPDLRFFVAYVVQRRGARETIHARLFYKDLSLIWRSASHVIRSGGDLWIGKGAIETRTVRGYEEWESIEQTTDLPIELQPGIELCNRGAKRVPLDYAAMTRVLRNAPPGRYRPYSDFNRPRERAAADPRNLVHGGRRIARFRRRNDPESLVFARGYEPDFARGVVERSPTRSSMYGGELQRLRVLSSNGRIQYLFFAGESHAWVIPPQTLTRELSSYAVRTVDVRADDDLFVPGFEYHYMDDEVDPPELVTQIPPGFAGAPNETDPSRCDASAWLERLPVIRELRRHL